ncbi:hypothetical protein TBLA_0A05590 [Henningerozyma blattae CBS 6284]|uniref:Orc1-like AAA ATPase domain-containing protein n=1 Tax=Henningerozyma blattae (strain ATCC 34711 / CBS 6284 / DSM 70876 / NBRC 10599 / NRRL Y-10934 / UCD 77-7) TaxID=1071380 RepID=I2GW50_HENB6|nr:hypothetical protein TBLA_0A05590 [Tetrapisispora blattae CBS 6284]CCH58352.1 hypothetical protein TBLA_0A05590 [Tetrapisispora blattae CBS 6284]
MVAVLHRDYQIKALRAFIQKDAALVPPNMIIEGHTCTGKTHVLTQFFQIHPDIITSWVRPIELVSWKPVLQAVARSVQNSLRATYPGVQSEEFDPLDVEEAYLLVKFLTNLFEEYSSLSEDRTLFVIFDGLDSLEDLDAMLLLKFLKLYELLPETSRIKLKFIYVVQNSAFVSRYASYGIPSIVFPIYNIDEVTDIIIANRAPELWESSCLHDQLQSQNIVNCTTEQLYSLVVNFLQLIIQSFGSYTGNNISSLNDFIDFKWEDYVKAITPQNVFEPVQLYRCTSKLFTNTDDTLSTEDENIHNNTNDAGQQDSNSATQTYELSNIAKYLLISAYICSYMEPKYDPSVFSKKTHLRSGRSAYGRRKKKETNPRYIQPSLFVIERLLAIFQSIYPVETNSESGSLASLKEDHLMRSNVEVFQNISELYDLKLLGTTMTKNIDYLSFKLKWKVNVPWETINEIASSVNFELGQYFSSIHE